MLKIKDNVTSKQLKKFGFKKDTFGYSYEYNIREDFINIGTDRTIVISIYYGHLEDVLFDLIQAGLVEKVGD